MKNGKTRESSQVLNGFILESEKIEEQPILGRKTPELERTFTLLASGEWQEVSEILAKIRNEYENNHRYWIALLLCKYRVKKEQRLARMEVDFSEDPFYIMALNCAEDDDKERIKRYCYNGIYVSVRKQLATARLKGYPEEIIQSLKMLQGFKDADQLLENYCQELYQYAKSLRDKLPEAERVERMRKILNQLADLNPNDDLITYCLEREPAIAKRQQAKKFMENMNKEVGEKWVELSSFFMESGDYDYVFYCYDCAEENGRNCKKEKEELICFLDEKIDNGKTGFLFFRGTIYYVMGDYERAARFYEAAYRNQEPYSAYGMGSLYAFEAFKDMYETDFEKSRQYFKEACSKRDDPETCLYYVMVSKLVNAENTDYKELIKKLDSCTWWCYDGVTEKLCGDLYWELDYREGNLPKDAEKSLAYYRKAAEKGNRDAMEKILLSIDDRENHYPRKVYQDTTLLMEMKQYGEVLFKEKRYSTAYLYAQFFGSESSTDKVFCLNRKRQAQIIFEAAEEGDPMALYCCTSWLLENEIPNLKSWTWLHNKLDKLNEYYFEYKDQQRNIRAWKAEVQWKMEAGS